jgi:hypothetical protein
MVPEPTGEHGMPQVSGLTITREAHNALRGRARPGDSFVDMSQARPDGMLDIPVREETIERIEQAQIPGETISDTIIRICATAGRKLS